MRDRQYDSRTATARYGRTRRTFPPSIPGRVPAIHTHAQALREFLFKSFKHCEQYVIFRFPSSLPSCTNFLQTLSCKYAWSRLSRAFPCDESILTSKLFFCGEFAE